MKTRTERIDRITAELEASDGHFQIPNNFQPQFYMEPTTITVELDSREPDFAKAIRRATITGQRYRVMASGNIKKVGGRRGGLETTPTDWTWPAGAQSMPRQLIELIREVSYRRDVREREVSTDLP